MESPVTPNLEPSSHLLRWAYRGVWFFAVPLALAVLFVWALNPSGSVDDSGAFGWFLSAVHEQPVPIGIAAFTLFEMAVWSVRHHLPLSKFAHAPLRPDLPNDMRAPYERARALLEEAETILAKHEKTLVRDLTSAERDRVRADLDALKREMEKTPFDADAFVDALVKADGEVDVRLGQWRKSELREYVESILIAIGVALALRAVVVEAFKIPSGSMIPTLQVGDHIFVNKYVYGPAIPFTDKRFWSNMPPHRGDVIVFAYPENMEQDFIKRVIALPGDKLEAKSGHPIINGWEVPHCYVGVYSYTEDDAPVPHHEGDLFVEYLGGYAFLTLYDKASGGMYDNQGPFYVKPGEVYVMGDNRNNSHDSRLWFGGQGGGVPYVNIRGRAMFVWLSMPTTGVDLSRLGVQVLGMPKLPAAMKALQPAMDKCMREHPPVEKTMPPPPQPTTVGPLSAPAIVPAN